jgi:hypothetical protein
VISVFVNSLYVVSRHWNILFKLAFSRAIQSRVHSEMNEQSQDNQSFVKSNCGRRELNDWWTEYWKNRRETGIACW